VKFTVSRDQRMAVCDGRRYVFFPLPGPACRACSFDTFGRPCPLGRGPLSRNGPYRRMCDGSMRRDRVNGCWKEVPDEAKVQR
jgi:hypothetical protein